MIVRNVKLPTITGWLTADDKVGQDGREEGYADDDRTIIRICKGGY